MRGKQNLINQLIKKDTLYTPPIVGDMDDKTIPETSVDTTTVVPAGFLPPKPKENAFLPMDYGQDVDAYQKAVEEFEKEAQEVKATVKNILGEDYFLSIDDKHKKVAELDVQILKLRDQIEETAEAKDEPESSVQLVGGMLVKAIADRSVNKAKREQIASMSGELASLMQRKRNLEKETAPVTPGDMRQLKANGIGIYGRIIPEKGMGEMQNTAKLIERFGEDWVMKTYRETVKSDLNTLQQRRYESSLSANTPDPKYILSWNNFQYGKAGDLVGASPAQIDSLWNETNLKAGFGGKGNTIDDKVKLLGKAVNNFLAGKEEVEDKPAAYKSIMSHLLPKLAFDEDGSMSPEGIKLFGQWVRERKTMLADQLSVSDPFDLISGNYPHAQFMKPETFRKLSADHGSENVKSWMNIQSRDRYALYHTDRLLEKIDAMPEQRGGFADIGKAMKQTAGDYTRFATMGILEATDKAYLERIIQKAGKGENLTPGEDIFLTTWATLNHLRATGSEGTVYQVASGVVNMVPYIAQYALTTPAYGIAHKATLKAVAPATRSLMGKRLGNRVADWTALQAARGAGVLTQAAALPQMTAINAMEYMRDEVVLSDEMGELTAKVYANSGTPTGKAVAMGFGSTAFEMGWERAGQIIMAGPKWAGKKISAGYTARTGKSLAQGKFIDNYMRLKGIVGIDDMMKHVDQHHLGWHGVFEEYLEELGTSVSTKLMEGKNPFGDEFLHEQYITFLTVAAFGGLMGSTRTLRSYIVGPDIKYDVKGADGKISSYKMPFHMHKELMSILNNDSAFFDEKKVEAFYDKYSKELQNEDLSKLTILLTADIGSQKAAWYAKKHGPQSKKGEPVPGFDPHVMTHEEESSRPNLSEEDRTTIETENKRILSENPELAENNLLMMDQATGQYLEPTKEVIDELYSQTLREYSTRADIDSGGNLLNANDVASLKGQLNVLEKYRMKQIDQTTPWANLTPIQKQKRLIAEINAGESMKGNLSYISDRSFQVKLRDGRTIKAYYDPSLSKAEREKVRDAILNNEDAEIIHQGTLDWNPDLMIVDARGVPYYDRAAVKVGGKIIGAIEVTDYRAENLNEKKEKEKKEKVESAIATAANKVISAAPKAPAVIAEETTEASPAVPKYSVEDKLKQQAHQSQLDKLQAQQGKEIRSLQQTHTKGKDVVSYLESLHERVVESDLRIKALADAGKSTTNAEAYQRRLKAEIAKISAKFNDITERHGNAIASLEKDAPSMAPTRAEIFKLQESKAGNDFQYSEYYNEAVEFMTEFMEINGLQYDRDYSHLHMSKIIGMVDNPIVKAMAERFAVLFNSLNVNVMFVETLTHASSGEYDIQNNRIIIAVQRMAQDYANRKMVIPTATITNLLRNTFMHEGVHAFTALKVRAFEHLNDKDPRRASLVNAIPLEQYEFDAISTLNNLFLDVRGKAREAFQGRPVFSNLHEFIAYSLTDVQLINYLKGIQIESDGKKRSAFQEFWHKFMQFLGVRPKTTLHDYVSKLIFDIGALYVPSDAFAEAEKYNEIITAFEAVNGNMFSGDRLYMENQITPDNRDQVFQIFLDSVLDQADNIIPGEEMARIKTGIDLATNLSQEDKGMLHVMVDTNEETIIRMMNQRRAANKGWVQKYKAPSINDLVLAETTEGIIPTGAQKVAAMLNSFSPLWSHIATTLNVSRDEVERNFYLIAKRPDVIANMQNESIYQEFVASLYGQSNIIDAIADALKNAEVNNAASLFNFYSNTSLTKQYKVVVRNGVASRVLLNPSQRYEEFMNSFWSTVTRYSYKGLTGYEAIQRRLIDHNSHKTQIRFNERNWSEYLDKPAEEKERLRREQHQEDLVLLSETTGVPIKLWDQYFKQQTRETFALPTKESEKEVDFTSYDNLLSHDTWRRGTAATYPRIESNLVFQLRLKSKITDLASFEEAFIRFFTMGTEDGRTLSNLYKLSTAIEARDEIGLRGFDVKGDSFSSFVQTSNLQDIAHNIRQSWADNHVTRFYREQGRDSEIVYLNGVQLSEREDDYNGFDAINMSSKDLWTTQLILFLEEGDTYMHWLGQFGDKPALHFMEVPKFKDITDKQIEGLRKKIKDFDQAVDNFVNKFIEPNISLFEKHLPKSSSFDEIKASRRRLAIEFLFNFAANINATNNILYGESSNYDNSLVKMVKRGGSTNSPGYKLNPYIEGGVGHEYRFALLDDRFAGNEIFDGIEFMSGAYAKRMQVSMGSKFSKDQVPEFSVLSSVKALISLVNDKGRRGLTKTNRVNIDTLADAFPKSMYAELRDFMRENQVDVLSFGSGTKMYEAEGGKKPNQIMLWDETGKKIKKPIIPDNGIITRLNENVYVQQDLRHSATPKTTPMPAQMHANMMVLGSGTQISEYINRLQEIVLDDFMKTFQGKDLSEVKLQWLLENINEDLNPDIFNMLSSGATVYEPALMNYFKKMIAGYVERKALELPINRVTTQEIPDPGVSSGRPLLQGRRTYEHTNEEGIKTNYILLPDISSNIEGARYENTTHRGNPKAAIKYVLEHKDEHLDLFDESGVINEWEITGRNGVIPGDVIISTRVPADDLHSHPVARLKTRIAEGNFTMLDEESRLASGADFDGDQRYNQVFYKDKNGRLVTGNTRQAIANKIMLAIAADYSNPLYDERIRRPIDTRKYKTIVSKYQSGRNENPLDWRAHDMARNENMNGVKMKGILTDAVTIYGLLSPRQVKFKEQISLPAGAQKYETKGFKGYKGGFDNSGKGTPQGDGKDKAMRKIADGFIGETNRTSELPQKSPYDIRSMTPTTSTTGSFKTIGLKYSSQDFFHDGVTIGSGKLVSTDDVAKVIMLARNGSLRGNDLTNTTKESIKEYHDQGSEFVVGDMPGVDSAFIDYLQEIGATFTIYYGGYSPRITQLGKQSRKYINLSGFAKDPHGLLKSHLTNFLNLAFDNANDPQLESIGFNEITSNMWVMALLGDSSLNTRNEKAIMQRIADLAEFFRSEEMDRFVNMVREAKGAFSKMSEFEAVQRFRGDEETSTEETKLITNLYYRSNEFPKLRMFYSLTQNMPATATDYTYNQILYRQIASNDKKAFKFIDVKPLFEVVNGVYGPVTEFATASKALDIARNIIHKDSFMMSPVGAQILAKVRGFAEVKEGKEIMYNDLVQIERMLNRAAVLTAISGQYNPRVIEVELVKALSGLKKQFPENRFLQVLHLMPLRSQMTVGIDPNLRHGRISEKALAEIHAGFNELYLSEDSKMSELAKKFAIHTINRYGITTTNNRGGYYNLVSTDARVDFSSDVANELDRWTGDGLTSMEKMEVFADIMRRVYPAMFTEAKFPRTIRAKAPIAELGGTSMSKINSEALEALTTADTGEAFVNIASAYGIDHTALYDFLKEQYGLEGRSLSQVVTPAIRRFLTESSAGKITQEYRESADKNFPPIAPPVPGGVKSMLPSDAIHEALATDDIALQDFIFQHLNKKYPEVFFFSNRDEFMAFVESRGGSGYDVSLHAIGLAFENAVLIDPNKAVQSTQIHEHAHIYWDALPQGHEVKERLLTFYREEYTGLNDAQLEEQIILDLGRAGTDLAGVMFRGTALQKFLEHMKAFWRVVKTFVLGNPTKNDLVRELAWDIWQNSDLIHSGVVSTNEGAYQVKHMIDPNHPSETPLSFADATHTYTLGGEIIPSTSSVLDAFVANAFDQDMASMAFIQSYERKIEKLTGYRYSEKDSSDYRENLKRRWREGNADSGTAVHKVFESFFRAEAVHQEAIDKFSSHDLYLRTQNLAVEFWEDINNVYPNAKAYPEMMLASRARKIGGTSDLVVDTGEVDDAGNHILVVYDLKFVKEQLADEDMSPLSGYKTPHGLYRAPFQNLANSKYTRHMLQTNIYANMLEERKNKNGIGNVVERIRIIPIIGTVTADNKIGSVSMGNWVHIPRTDRTKEITSQMMELSYSQRRNLEEIFDKYDKILKDQSVPQKIRTDMLKAMHFMSMVAGDPRLLTKTHVDNIRHLGLKSTYAFLIAEYVEDENGNMMDNSGLGYTNKDIYGTSTHTPLTAEELFFIAVNKISRNQYFGYAKMDNDGNIITYPPKRDELFVDVPIYERFTAVKNPEAVKRKYHRYKDRILQDVGIDNVQRGDELFMVYDVPGPLGGRERREVMYTVLDVARDKRKVHVRMQDTYEEIDIYVPGNYIGLHKLHQTLPAGIEDPGPDSFVPAFTYEIEKVTEKHWKTDIGKDEYESRDSKAYVKARNMNYMRKFFGQFSTWAELEEYFSDEVNVQNLWERINSWDEVTFGNFKRFVRDDLVNHWMASGVKNEYSQFEGTVPPHLLPQTLNMYYIATRDPKALWVDFDHGWNGVRMNMPARFHSMKHAPFMMMTSQIYQSVKAYNQVAYDLDKEMEKFDDMDLDFDVMMYVKGGQAYWKHPVNVSKSIHPEEYAFLSTIYDYYIKYDPSMLDVKATGLIRLIPVAQIHGKAEEFVRNYGKRFGRTMFEKLKPSRFDSVRLALVDSFEDGQPQYIIDPDTGKPIVRTLSEIKAEFIDRVGSEEEKKKFLGSRWRHIFLKIPGALTTFGKTKAGMLNYYIAEADKIVSQGGDQYNDPGSITRSGKRIAIVGKGKVLLPTKHYIAAESEAITSMIKAFYLRKNMAPLDWMMEMYKEEGGDDLKLIGRWLKNWGEYQLYQKKPDEALMRSRIWHDLVDWVTKMNSLNKIAFSVSTQVNNLLIGQTLDVIREPGAFTKGFGRLHERGYNSLKKGFNILQRHGVANIVSESVFDQLDKQYRLFSIGGVEINLEDIENIGYWPMDKAEKMNQASVFVGLMTKEEWDSYDDNGNIKDPDAFNHLSSYRAMVLANMVQDIHGDYGTLAAAPAWLTAPGKAVWQFKKWLPTMLWLHVAPYHIDSNYQIRSGMFATVKLMSKILYYNNVTVRKSQEALQKKFDKWEKDPESAPRNQYIESVATYFNTLVEEANGGKISFRKLSENESRNLRQLTAEVALVATRMILLMTLFSGNDDKTFASDTKKIFTSILDRWHGDVLWVYNWDNWDYALKNLIPALQLLTSFIQTINDISALVLNDPKAFYQKEANLAAEGFPKAVISSTYWLPGGSAMRQLIQLGRKTNMKNTDYSEYLMKLGLDIDAETLMEMSNMSVWEAKESQREYQTTIRDINDALLYLKLEQAGINPEQYYETLSHISNVKKFMERYGEANANALLQQLMEQDGIAFSEGYTLSAKDIKKWATEGRRAKEKGGIGSLKKKSRNFQKNSLDLK